MPRTTILILELENRLGVRLHRVVELLLHLVCTAVKISHTADGGVAICPHVPAPVLRNVPFVLYKKFRTPIFSFILLHYSVYFGLEESYTKNINS